MQRINLYGFYRLSGALEPLRVRRPYGQPFSLSSVFAELSFARSTLRPFMATWDGYLPASKAPADAVLKRLDEMLATADPVTNWEAMQGEPVSPVDWNVLSSSVEHFEAVFAEEAALVDVYLVEPKGPFDTRRIVSGVEATLTLEVREAMSPEAISDYREAGRCLAFAVFTASGFHALRALEGVVVAFHHKKTAKDFGDRYKSWEIYAENLEREGTPAELVALIRQIKNHHRNPLMHPADFLNEEEAVVLFGIVTSAIVSFVRATMALPAKGAVTLSPAKKIGADA